jgi:hypothetical protein
VKGEIMKTYLISMLAFLSTVSVGTPIVLACEKTDQKSEVSSNKIEKSKLKELGLRLLSFSNKPVLAKEQNKVEINGNKFEIMGSIDSVGTGTFTVAGVTVYVDPTAVPKLEQKGILKVGEKVKTEGLVKDGKNYAMEIMVIGTGQGKFKFEYKARPSTSPVPTASASPAPTTNPSAEPTSSPTPSGSPEPSNSPEPSMSPSPSASASANPTASPEASESPTPSNSPETINSGNLEVRAVGVLEDIKTFFEQLMSFFKTI